MDMNSIIIAAVVIAAVGIIVGVGLGLFGAKFKVEVDEKEAAVREELPGNNCGGCGYPGCDGRAKAIAEGKDRSMPARSAALRLARRSLLSWV